MDRLLRPSASFAHSLRPRKSKKVQKNFEHIPIYGVYYSMTNGWIIEGHAGKSTGCSDLNLAIGCAGQHSNTAHASSLRLKAKWRMARSGKQRAGRQGATISGRFAYNLGNPYAEKEARLRSQQLVLKWSTNCSLKREVGGVSRCRYGLGPFYFRGGIIACLHNATGTSRLGGQEAAPVPPLDFL